MKVEELGQKLFESARIHGVDPAVPVAFEKRVMAQVLTLSRPCSLREYRYQDWTFAQLWGGVSSALVMLLLVGGIYFYMANRSSVESTYDDVTIALNMESVLFSGITCPPGIE